MATNVNRDGAETLALEALAFLAEDEDRLMRFLGQSGLEGRDLKALAGAPETLAAVLDYLLADEALAKAFCEASGTEARLLLTAQHVLGTQQIR